jgi:NADPH-dependent glutamate synthase beta subunit-like oxidoreductase/NAD(P)H-flavin reductase
MSEALLNHVVSPTSSDEFSNPGLTLGVPGFVYADLYLPERLKTLADLFYAELAETAPEIHQELSEYIDSRGASHKGKAESELLISAAPYLSRFVARLFNVESRREELIDKVEAQDPIWLFKHFIARRALKKVSADKIASFDGEALHQELENYRAIVFPDTLSDDPELGIARMTVRLLDLEKALEKKLPLSPESEAALEQVIASRDEFSHLCGRLELDLQCGIDTDGLGQVRAVLELIEAWAATHATVNRDHVKDWVSFHVPHSLDYEYLVQIERPVSQLPELMRGLDKNLRRRDGFGLTDPRANKREVLSEIDYCLYCHERDKDSCSKGLHERDGSLKRNPLGIKLEGCPLDEKISEMHVLKKRGDSIASLVLVMIDNPMCPGTGHRICNDCMKSCIFQKQEPVNIPQAETGILTDVLELPFGFEIYSLLTRWNPLNAKRPYALPYNGKNVLVVGLGPAGYTLAHYLLNEGFGVIGIDGLKIEPLNPMLTGTGAHTPRPVRDINQIEKALDQRILAGFGGVSEYGITVRWDKNFLTMIHLTLARRDRFRFFGGVRFGGTLTIEDAWELGFDHIAIATGAGKPTIVSMKNNLIRGIRKASDFLMALQLTGAFKRDAFANLQVRLPALVIGGGLTAIDTATELFAYYPVQVEKMLQRHDALVAEFSEKVIFKRFDAEELATYTEFLEHGRAIRAERARAEASGEKPNFIPLVRSWGGVSIVYRKRLQDSPAYRLNHEEVVKALEEGINFIENLSPVEAIPCEYGAVESLVFERSGDKSKVTLPARSVCVAAGTSPNIIYEKEKPGTFALDEWNQFFSPHKVVVNGDGEKHLVAAAKGETGFFTSYEKDGRFISYYGDNHPVYAGNVVKAMASAKFGYEHVTALFAEELKNSGDLDQDSLAARFTALVDYLEQELVATVVRVDRLTETIVDVIVRAPMQARKFHPGQFYRLQNFETDAVSIDGTKLMMEGIALTGAWVDVEKGLLSLIVLEMGVSSRLCASLKPGQQVIVMGPTGTPTEIPNGETVLLAGGGLGNAVLFSIAKALREQNNHVIYFAGFKRGEDLFKRKDIEAATDQVIWATDTGVEIAPSRPQDSHFRGNIVQAMLAYSNGELGKPMFDLSDVDRIIAIGSDRMMAAVKQARHGVLAPYLKQAHVGIGSINSPMQCMMKEVCAQCLQKHIDPVTGKESFVFSCFNQDQLLDEVDFKNLNDRLRANTVQEKVSNLWLDKLLRSAKIPHV